ncbi:hypothetical protein ACNTMW_26780 [Planosporangium sp. 12N6]
MTDFTAVLITTYLISKNGIGWYLTTSADRARPAAGRREGSQQPTG